MQTSIVTSIKTELKHAELVEKFTRFLCHELDVFPHQITIAAYEVDDSTYGLCIDESENEFLILVKQEGRDIGQVFTTIAHEMIHVKQYVKENLAWFLHNRNHIPYMERWWEKEAFSFAVPLVEKFAKTLKETQ
jgi:hypothetical protein